MESPWRRFKIQKSPVTLIYAIHIKNISNPSGDPVPLTPWMCPPNVSFTILFSHCRNFGEGNIEKNTVYFIANF
jgi:hypothetical protein